MPRIRGIVLKSACISSILVHVTDMSADADIIINEVTQWRGIYMNIIIVGCGKVGYALAEQLNEEGHEITIIDMDEKKVNNCSTSLDVMGVVGNGTSYRIQEDAGIEEADLLIAVTGKDEINLLSCLIARKAGNCQTIARVRDPEYYREINYIQDELGLAMAINPESAAAEEIARLIQFPSALEIDSFARGKVDLVTIKIPKGSRIHEMRVAEFSSAISRDVLICMVKRPGQILIPDGNTVLMEGDSISLVMPMANTAEVFRKIGIQEKPIRNVMIAGGSMVSYYLAKRLLQQKINVKILEKSQAKCSWLSDLLPKALIINGDATDKRILLEEGIHRMDALVALTDMDEENVLLALYAGRIQSLKLVTKITKTTLEEVVGDMQIGSVVCPKNITAENIIQYVRSMQNSYGSNVQALYRMVDNRVEALEFTVKKDSRVINKPLSTLKLKDQLLLGSIYRDNQLIIPTGKDTIQVGDSVIVVTIHKGLNNLDEILAE